MNWLIVERHENWLADKAAGFSMYGVPEKKRRLAGEVRVGDKLIAYVSSGFSAFADIREATAAGLTHPTTLPSYGGLFPHVIMTRPILTLSGEQWVRIDPLISRLSFIRNKQRWGSALLNSLRRLDDADAGLLIDAITLAAAETISH